MVVVEKEYERIISAVLSEFAVKTGIINALQLYETLLSLQTKSLFPQSLPSPLGGQPCRYTSSSPLGREIQLYMRGATANLRFDPLRLCRPCVDKAAWISLEIAGVDLVAGLRRVVSSIDCRIWVTIHGLRHYLPMLLP